MSNILVDISGNGNNGTIVGASQTKDGLLVSKDNLNYVDIGNINFTGDFSIDYRFKSMSGLNYLFGRDTSINSSYCYHNSGQFTFRIDGTTHTFTTDVQVNSVHTLSLVRELDVVSLYLDGSKHADTPTLAGTLNIEYLFRDRTLYADIEGIDAKFYNNARTSQQAKDYHNSWANQISLKEDYKYDGADETKTYVPDTQKGTGNYVVGEIDLTELNVEQITNGSFDTDDDWNKQTGWTISDGKARCDGTQSGNSRIFQITNIIDNRLYRVTYDLEVTAGTLFMNIGGNSSGIVRATSGSYSETIVCGTDDDNVLAVGNLDFIGTIDNICVKEIPPLPGYKNGTKYQECETAGTQAYQQKEAYGTWEFDMNKGAGGNLLEPTFISSNKNVRINNDGYFCSLNEDERFVLGIANSGTYSILNFTAISYIDLNTWYRTKVDRLSSDGTFLDIPTLQTSDMENSTAAPYTTFTAEGSTGFNAISNGGSSHFCGTADELSLVNTTSYLVEFDCVLNSGTLGTVRFMSGDGSGSMSNVSTITDGRNSIILTATSTATGRLFYNNASVAVNFTVANLSISEIYPVGTFAVFIKGGSFGTEGWTLVDTTSGSGQNPVTDNTYTESKFLVIDADADDRIGKIIKTRSVSQ